LSAVSSVRTTAAILADTDDIDPAWRQRFHKNLHADSERLAQGAEALVAYLDGAAPGQDQSVASPQEEVEAWAEACDWMLTEAEDLTQSAHLASGAGRALAQGLQAQMASDVAALPEPDFSDALAQLGPDPLALAQSFGAPVQHIAFASDDILATARALVARGFASLPMTDNYYADLASRFDIAPDLLASLRAHHILYDRDAGGEFFQIYSRPFAGGMFFEIVERRGDYRGYGAPNAAFRIAAQKRLMRGAAIPRG
jgi:hypothetical protein